MNRIIDVYIRDQSHCVFFADPENQKQFSKHGYTISVNNKMSNDIIFVDADCLSVPQLLDIIKDYKSAYIIEAYDAAYPLHLHTMYQNYPKIKGIFKHSILRDNTIMRNQKLVWNTCHLGTVINELNLVSDNNYNSVTDDEIAFAEGKVHIGSNYFTRTNCDFVRLYRNLRKEQVMNMKRNIDVSFAGTVVYVCNGSDSRYIDAHRLAYCDLLDKLSKDFRTSVVRGRNLDYPTYAGMCVDCKVLVSPWGWGEPCYRDYEALMFNCECIKPDTRYVKTIPDVYDDSYGYYYWANTNYDQFVSVLKTSLQLYESRLEYRMNRWDEWKDLVMSNKSVVDRVAGIVNTSEN